jgi:hypothetical protein
VFRPGPTTTSSAPARHTGGKVKLTFAKGAALPDPHGLFNASLDGKVRRAIDLHQDDRLDEPAFIELVRAAVALNAQTAKR